MLISGMQLNCQMILDIANETSFIFMEKNFAWLNTSPLKNSMDNLNDLLLYYQAFVTARYT